LALELGMNKFEGPHVVQDLLFHFIANLQRQIRRTCPGHYTEPSQQTQTPRCWIIDSVLLTKGRYSKWVIAHLLLREHLPWGSSWQKNAWYGSTGCFWIL